MKAKPPATPRARELLAKLIRLAERGVNGEKANAEKKLERLLKRYDFSAPDLTTKDLFAGAFRPATVAVPVATISEPDIASAVKWCFEHAARIECIFRGPVLLAQADDATAKRMSKIAETVSEGFRELWQQYAKAGANPADRGNFMLGLYEGMMRDERQGQALPSRAAPVKLAKAKRKSVALAPGLNLHPYSVAVNLGRSIRFELPITEITAQLERTIKGEIAA